MTTCTLTHTMQYVRGTTVMCECADSPACGWAAGSTSDRATRRDSASEAMSRGGRSMWLNVGSDPSSRHVRFVSGSQRTVEER
jgi:hypothetical protein